MSTKIFISYSHKDSDLVEQLQADLSSKGFDVWWDRSGLRGGDSWRQVIADAIRQCMLFLFIASPAAMASKYVQDEFSLASDCDKRIIPLKYKAFDKPFLGLSNTQWIDFESSYSAGFARLMADIGPLARSAPQETGIFSHSSPRIQTLWRLAYAFLRLDQLPSGGWGKTLPGWMETIWEGDRGSITRSSDTRLNGGVDLTTYAFYQYYRFLEKVLSAPKIPLLLNRNGSAARVYDNIASRINSRGEVGAGFLTAIPAVRVRHTLMAFITFLLYRKANANAVDIQTNLSKIYPFLVDNISKWQHDRSHHYALIGAAVKLCEMLQDSAGHQLSPAQAEALQIELSTYIPDLTAEVCTPLNYTPLPVGTIEGPLTGCIFRPYGDFWRMERSSFLMHLHFLMTDDGQTFLPDISSSLKIRCAQILCELLEDIQLPYDEGTPLNHLLRYHRTPTDTLNAQTDAPRDWGVSAELAALLQMKAVRDLLVPQMMNDQHYDEHLHAISQALLDSFDGYHEYPELFRFTHGASFGRAVHLFDKHLIATDVLENLDSAITRLCAEGITEQGLMGLLKEHICVNDEDETTHIRALKDMLVSKLEAGEYTPDAYQVCRRADWERRVHRVVSTSTLEFYDSQLSDQHVQRYLSTPRLNLGFEVHYLFEQLGNTPGRILDVGCGAGQYAELFAQMGFEVHLLDASRKMLNLACTRLGMSNNTVQPVNIFDNSWGYPEHHFNLIFASAIMIHVPEENRPHIYAMFRRYLSADGVLFVNYKIGDHTLISHEGRYFAYYRDEVQPQQELESSGFQVRTKIVDANYRDMYQSPKLIRWAHFCCTLQ